MGTVNFYTMILIKYSIPKDLKRENLEHMYLLLALNIYINKKEFLKQGGIGKLGQPLYFQMCFHGDSP